MNILTITLCNLTSIEGEQIIDFTSEPLRSAGLFAITGDTGAGKSSVLDAICLALYGTAPRLEQAESVKKSDLEQPGNDEVDLTPKDARIFLRKGQKEGYAHLRFSTAEGEIYEAQWKVRINRNNNLAPTERALYRVTPKGVLDLITTSKSELKTEVQRIVGLDYAQFSRTAILAQNSFATFLQADARENSQLLEKLTGTDIYGRISAQIFSFNKEAAQEVERLEAQQLGASKWRLTEADVAEHEERSQHLAMSIANRQKQLESIDVALKWYADNAASEARLNQATETHAQHNKAYLALRSEERWLERYDSVQPFRSLFEQIKEKRAVIEGIKREEQTTAAAAETQRQQLAEADKLLIIARERKVDAEEQQRIKLPSLNAGYALEGEIKTFEEHLEEANQALNKAQQRHAEKAAHQHQQQAENERLKQKYEELNLRRQSLAIHQSMFEQFQGVNDKLAFYNSETTANERIHLNYSRATHRQSDLQGQFDKAKNTLQSQRDKLAALRSSHKVHVQAIEDLDPTELHSGRSKADQRVQSLRVARRLWSRIVEGYEAIDETRAKLERLARQLDQKRKELQLLEREDDQLLERFLQLQKAYTLSQIENLKALRQQLKEGMPCPVCGSAHHPYHTEVEQESGERQNQLEKDYHEAEQNYQAKHVSVKKLRQDISQREGELLSEQSGFQRLVSNQQQLEEDWTTFADLDSSFADCTPTVNREGRATTIEMLVDSTNRQLDNINERIKKFDFHSAQIKAIDLDIHQVEDGLESSEKQYTSLEVELKLVRERIDNLHTAMRESDVRVEQVYKDLDDVVTVSGWRDANLDEFSKYISSLYADWRSVNTQLVDTEQQRAVACTRLENLQQVVESELAEVNLQRERRDRLREQLGNKRDEMKRLFGDSTPALLAEALQKNVDAAAAHHQRLLDEREAHNMKLQHLLGQRTKLETTQQQQEDEMRARSTELDHAIARYNLEHTPLQAAELAQLFEDGRDVNHLRATIELCRHNLLLATNIKDEAQKEYLRLQSLPTRPSDREDDQPDALHAHQEQLQEDIKQLNTERTQCQHALLRHNDSDKEATHLEEQVKMARANAEEWARLNQLFGSADGKRFRDMAQSFTFAALVEHANYHLRQLSPRYELRVIKGSLTLEIIDHDMLDERRFVSSLSGGETFIVSLSLALGLASLSNTTLNIGSLFIDEGFGNLDQDSLAMVLDTLSALERNQGRKVGVVSHTEQIRSQIYPQIQVMKQGNEGKSTIQIVG